MRSWLKTFLKMKVMKGTLSLYEIQCPVTYQILYLQWSTIINVVFFQVMWKTVLQEKRRGPQTTNVDILGALTGAFIETLWGCQKTRKPDWPFTVSIHLYVVGNVFTQTRNIAHKCKCSCVNARMNFSPLKRTILILNVV